MRVVGCVLALIILAGCGGSSATDGATEDTDGSGASDDTAASSSPAPKSDSAAGAAADPDSGTAGENTPEDDPAGTSDPAALSDLQCRPDDDNQWNATGTLTNHHKKPATFQLTVAVTSQDASGKGTSHHKATTKQFATIQPKDSVRVEITDIKAGDDAQTCRVQVLMSSG